MTDIRFVPIEGISYTPVRATPASANVDLRAAEDVVLWPGAAPVAVSVGVRTEFDPNFVLEIYPRSGLAKQGIIIPNSPGQVDADYRGEVKVLLAMLPTGDQPYPIYTGERIAQCRLVPVVEQEWLPVEELTETYRGEGGMGSTGKE